MTRQEVVAFHQKWGVWPIGGGAGNTTLTREYERIFSIVRDETQPVLWDNISARTKLLFRLKEMGAILKIGGEPILRFTIMKELPTSAGYTDLDTLTPVRPDPFTSVVYSWKQINTPVQVSGLDMIKTGDKGIVNLLMAFLNVAEVSQRDAIGGSSIGIFSSLATTDLTGISGLATHFTTSTTTGSVGLLSRASQSAWQHQLQNVASAFDTNGLNRMRTLYRQCSFFDDVPDTIVGTGSFAENYERELTSTFQVNLPLVGSQGMIDAGFPNVLYKGSVLFDDDGCPANRAYFLNLRKYIRLIVREGRDAEIGDFVKSQSRDDLVTFVLSALELINTGLRYGGLLQNADTF